MSTETKKAEKPKIKIKKVNVSYIYKRAYLDYEVLQKWSAGIILQGWEVKSLDHHGGDLNASYCKFSKNNFTLINCKIAPTSHEFSNKITTKEIYADRTLLLNKSELKKIKKELEVKGLTCIPLSLERNNKYLWKIEIAIVKPKNKGDKRNDLKIRDLDKFEKRNNLI